MNDNMKKICAMTDHTNLKKTATEDDIRLLCEEAVKYGAKSVCIPPCFVEFAKELLKDQKPCVCTVIGFPNGYSTPNIKKAEAKDAILNGADEIDMVVNINFLKDKKFKKIFDEIKCLAHLCHEKKYFGKEVILKVIIETCLLTDEEKEIMCDICIHAGADYIKTSTGFDDFGATVHDIELFKKKINGRKLKIKAAGGIKDIDEAQMMIDAGADRIGASRICKNI